jgi:hypothetical protein
MLVKFLGQCVQKFVFELSLEILEFGKNMLESKLKSFKIVRIDFKIKLGEPPSEFKVSKLEIETSLQNSFYYIKVIQKVHSLWVLEGGYKSFFWFLRVRKTCRVHSTF